MLRPKQQIKRIVIHCMLLTLMFAMATLLNRSHAPTDLERIQKRGYINMITRYGPATYFVDARGENGLEYLMAKAFAEHLGVELRVSVEPSIKTLLRRVNSSNVDFAAANLNINESRKQIVNFSIPNGETIAKLLYNTHNRTPKDFNDVTSSKFVIIPDSSHSEFMQEAKEEYPHLEWTEKPDSDSLELMSLLEEGTIDYTIADYHNYLLNRTIFPSTRVGFDVGEPLPTAWAFSKGGDGSLLEAANSFVAEWLESDTYKQLVERFYTKSDQYQVTRSQQFVSRIKERLPEYEPKFRAAGKKYNLDWRLIAAIAYQESHWNPLARSPTGVRGLMMLTNATAKEMGVTDRLDPDQSLDGGVRYLLKTKEKIPDRIPEPDRTWFALASYNVGYGHLEDARILTARAGRNPDLWEDVREFLPLLSQKKYYSTVKRGYARGYEPVHYVRNIRLYFDILVIHSIDQARKEPIIEDHPPEESVDIAIPAPL